MLTESELTAEIRAGLEAVTPPAPWLSANVEKRVRASRPQRRMFPTPPALRLGLNLIALVVLIALAVTAVGVFIVLHRPLVTVGPGSGPVIFPTKMVSPTTGWALVGDSELWRTVDGGLSWANVSPPHLPDRVVNADRNFFLDGRRAWITQLGGGRKGSPLYWVTFRTVDGGRTWQHGESLGDPFNPGSAQQYYIDANTGWLWLYDDDPSHTTWPILYRTLDGGLHWTLITSNAGSGASSGTAIPCGASITFASVPTGWMSLGFCEQTPSQNGLTVPDLRWVRDIFLATHDGGSTWQVQPLPITPALGTRFNPPVFFDQLHGIMQVDSSSHPTLLATSDGGNRWSVRSLPDVEQVGVDFVDANHGWAIGGPSSMFTKTRDNSQQIISLPLYHTDDGGSTWTPVQTNVRLEQPIGIVYSSFYFVDQKIGFGTLFTFASGPTEFLKTTDGGRTWRVVRACTAGLGWSNPPPQCPSPSP